MGVGDGVAWFQTRTTPPVAWSCTVTVGDARKISALPAPSFSTRKPPAATTLAMVPAKYAAPHE